MTAPRNDPPSTECVRDPDVFNEHHPIGTRVIAFPGSREGRAILTTTRSTAGRVGGEPYVMVEGYPGGIALTHIEVIPGQRGRGGRLGVGDAPMTTESDSDTSAAAHDLSVCDGLAERAADARPVADVEREALASWFIDTRMETLRAREQETVLGFARRVAGDVLAWLTDHRRPTDDDLDGPCRDCGRGFQSWFTDHAVWNLAMGGPDATDDPGGLLCMTCFTDRADPQLWRLTRAVLAESEQARTEAAVREALTRIADEWQWGAWAVLTETVKPGGPAAIIGAAQVVTDWLSDRIIREARP